MMTDKTILLVDDDEPAARLLQIAFEDEGITCPLQTVTDGERAIEYLARQGQYADEQKHPLPCLVLLDLSMPKLSGLDVLEWIRQQPSLRCLVVVVFSSSGQAADVERAYALGANSYIEKPMGMQQTREIARLLNGWWLRYNRYAPLHPTHAPASSPSPPREMLSNCGIDPIEQSPCSIESRSHGEPGRQASFLPSGCGQLLVGRGQHRGTSH